MPIHHSLKECDPVCRPSTHAAKSVFESRFPDATRSPGRGDDGMIHETCLTGMNPIAGGSDEPTEFSDGTAGHRIS
jgi:hypothetical protein